jgi:hypothetical protein
VPMQFLPASWLDGQVPFPFPQHSELDCDAGVTHFNCSLELLSAEQQVSCPIEQGVPPQANVGPAQLPAPSHSNVTSLIPGFVWVAVPQAVRFGFGWHVPLGQESLHAPVQAVPQQTPPTQKPLEQSLELPQPPPVLVLNVAVTLVAAVTVTLQVAPLTEEQPDQEANTPVADAVAASWTDVPWFTNEEQIAPQEMPIPGVVESRLPAPVGPASATESKYWFKVNVTPTVVPPLPTVTTHDPVALHGAPHMNVEPVCGVAVKVTCVPAGMVAEHVAPQLRLPPDHVAFTVPDPLPPFAMLKVAFLSTKDAVTWVAAVIDDIVHVGPVAVVHPVQLAKSKSTPGCASSVIVDPLSTDTTQVRSVQLMPPEPVTVPVPLR